MKELAIEGVFRFLVGLEVANVIFQPYSIDFGFVDGTYSDPLPILSANPRGYWKSACG
jgi:hypothetical protein